MSILESTQQQSRRVWQVLSDFNNITEQQARDICHDFTETADFPIHADGFACDYEDMISQICDNMEDPSIREAILGGNGDISLETDDDNDPFYYNAKISEKEVSKYLAPYLNSSFQCDICREEDMTEGGVQLSCSRSLKPCNSTFCKECIVPWITTCVARCPCCREFCTPLLNLPVAVKRRTSTFAPKKKILITIKKQHPSAQSNLST